MAAASIASSESYEQLRTAQQVLKNASKYSDNFPQTQPSNLFALGIIDASLQSISYLRLPLQKVLRSLEVASELLEELSKLSSSDKTLVKRHCEEYLQNLQAGLPQTSKFIAVTGSQSYESIVPHLRIHKIH